jgi:hypothetical protein
MSTSPANGAFQRAKKPTPSLFADLPWIEVLPKTSDGPVLPLTIGISDDLLLRLPEEH